MVYYRIDKRKQRAIQTKVGKKPSLIEINGQLFDANSGRLFHHPRGPVIDGFIKKTQAGQVVKKMAGTLSPNNLKAGAIHSAHTVHERNQRSNALMRRAVRRPHSNKISTTKLKSSKARTGLPSPTRISRAMNMVKNSQVERFGAPVASSKSLTSKVLSPKVATSNITPSSRGTSTKALALQTMPSMVTSASHQRLERMLDEALINADAHKKALKKRKSDHSRISRHLGLLPRWLTVSIVVLLVASVGTYFAWQKVPYVSMKFASVRAQVKGSLPDYIPSGFKFTGPIKYESGSISMTFKAEGERFFTLEQYASSWDSSSLEANSVPDDKRVQTSQVKGATVYVDSSNNEATWVSDGKRYKLRGQLDPDEIFKIAGSIL